MQIPGVSETDWADAEFQTKDSQLDACAHYILEDGRLWSCLDGHSETVDEYTGCLQVYNFLEAHGKGPLHYVDIMIENGYVVGAPTHNGDYRPSVDSEFTFFEPRLGVPNEDGEVTAARQETESILETYEQALEEGIHYCLDRDEDPADLHISMVREKVFKPTPDEIARANSLYGEPEIDDEDKLNNRRIDALTAIFTRQDQKHLVAQLASWWISEMDADFIDAYIRRKRDNTEDN